VGKAMVIPLQDVDRTMAASLFSGPDMSRIKALGPDGSVPSSIYAFLIKSGGNTILVDAGYGREDNPRSRLLEKLAEAKVRPEAVTHVLLTHLHGDHVGGLAWKGKAAFPNATVLVSAEEKAYWLDEETLKQFPGRKGNIDLIKACFALYGDKVKTFTFDGDVLPGITVMAARGHTPGHTAFLLASEGKMMLFIADLVHGAALQFPDPRICAQYDMDAPQAVAARLAFMELAVHKKIPVAGAHLPPPGVGRVLAGKDKGSFVYKPGL
jgi:glyoxylase-like metal-dependent hydrolase (beta-lactamase superfamily II)